MKRTPDPDELPRPELERKLSELGSEFDPPSDWQTRVWAGIDRGDREPPGPSWSARWLPWIVPALVLALTVALAYAYGGAR